MTASKAAQLRAVYAKIPHVPCTGACVEACSAINVSREERRIIVRTAGRAPTVDPKTATCSLLKDGRCSAYAVRPFICRLFGATPKLQCPFGCVPDRWLSEEEARAFQREIDTIGGADLKRFMREVGAMREWVEAIQ